MGNVIELEVEGVTLTAAENSTSDKGVKPAGQWRRISEEDKGEEHLQAVIKRYRIVEPRGRQTDPIPARYKMLP